MSIRTCNLSGIAVATLLLSTWSVQLAEPAIAHSGTEVESQFKQLERDIPSLYLVNGLFLSKEQTADLVSLLEKAKRNEEKANKKIEHVSKKHQRNVDGEIERTLRKISDKGEVNRKTLSSSSLKRSRERHKELSAIRREMNAKLNALADELYHEVLSDNQQHTVKNFKPCFIPARDFRNPQRVGQVAGNTLVGETVLSRLRKVPDHKMDHAKERTLDRIVRYSMQKRHIKYSEEAERKVRNELSARLEKVLPTALSLSDLDFELKKSTLSQELLPLEKKNSRSHTSPHAIRRKVRIYLLNTGNTEVLKSRLKRD